MNKSNDDFAARLREDADREAPEFSDTLHTRVMASIRRERSRTPITRQTLRRYAISIAACAIAIAIAIALTLWIKSPPESASPAPVVSLSTVPSLEQVVRETAAPMRQTLKDARFAYLDRDGKRLAKFLWQSVPGVTPPHKTDAGSS